MIKTKTEGEKPRADVLPPKTETPPSNGQRPGSRTNEDVEKRLNPYIEANPADRERYTNLVKENPERAVRSLMLKDLEWIEREVTLKKNQIAGAKDWVAKQSPETKAFIEQRLAETQHPQQRELALLQLVLNRMRFEAGQSLAAGQKPHGPAMAAAG